MLTQDAVDHGLVYDVGAHLGEDSNFYLKLGFRVVAVEANPALVKKLRLRFSREIESGDYQLVPYAIGDSTQEITFYVNNSLSVWGTTNPDWARRNERMGAQSEPIKVKCVQFADVLAEYGTPHYLKIDIEGADMLCVDALRARSACPSFLSIESNKTSWAELMSELNVLYEIGYRRFKVVDQRRHFAGDFATRDGKRVHHQFESDSSGPFGEHLAGEWLTREEAIMRYRSIFRLYRTIGDNRLLGRVLGKMPLLRRIRDLVSWYDTHAAL